MNTHVGAEAEFEDMENSRWFSQTTSKLQSVKTCLNHLDMLVMTLDDTFELCHEVMDCDSALVFFRKGADGCTSVLEVSVC